MSRVQKDTKKTKKRQKRTHFMCKQMLQWIRLQMLFDPRDMRATLVPPGCPPIPRRTYQDYEAGNRRIPAELAARIRDVFQRDRELLAGLNDRVDAAAAKKFKGGKIPSFQVEKEEE